MVLKQTMNVISKPLNEVTGQDFESVPDKQFQVTLSEEPRTCTLKLESITATNGQIRPLSVLLSGLKTESFCQQIVTITSSEFILEDVFIVPIRELNGFRTYELFFN